MSLHSFLYKWSGLARIVFWNTYLAIEEKILRKLVEIASKHAVHKATIVSDHRKSWSTIIFNLLYLGHITISRSERSCSICIAFWTFKSAVLRLYLASKQWLSFTVTFSSGWRQRQTVLISSLLRPKNYGFHIFYSFGTASQNICTNPRAKTSKDVRSRSVNFVTSMQGNFHTISRESPELLITVQDSCYFLCVICIVYVYEEFLNVKSKKRIASFQDKSLQWFRRVILSIFGFHANDIVLRESVADSDIVRAVSIHQTGVTDRNGDWDEDDRDLNGWRQRTWLINDQFTVITGATTELDTADASQLDFFYQLFTPKMFATIAE